MTIRDDPEIAVSGFGAPPPDPSAPAVSRPEPSAPPASAVAVATAVPTTAATSTIPAAAATAINTPRPTIERTSHPDGSLEVHVTTTTIRQDGYRVIRTENYHIPSTMASTAVMSMDVAPGTPPSNLYLTGVNQQVLPPGTGLAVVRPPPPSAPTSQTVQQPGMTAYPTENEQLHQQEIVNDGSYEKRQCVAVSACCICFFLVIVLPVLIGAVSNSNHATQYSPSPYIPSYYPPSTPTWDLPYDDDDYFSRNSPIYNFAPTAPPNPTTSPAPSRQHTMPPWLLPYFPPTTPPAPTTSPAPTIEFAPFAVYTLPPHFFSPTYYDPPSPSKGAMVPLPHPNHVSNVMDNPDRIPKTDDSQFDLSKSDKVNADSGATPNNNELDVDGGAPTTILS